MKDNTAVHFLINVSEDKQGLVNVPINLGLHKSKKDAKKAMMEQANKDLTHGRYYYYRLEEHKTIVHEIYPSIETTG